jgi:hypothetical protein
MHDNSAARVAGFTPKVKLYVLLVYLLSVLFICLAVVSCG